MSNFKKLKEAVRKQFDKMAAQQLYTVMVDKDKMWNLYLDSFPPGTNEIYKVRREYDCNCCKGFIRRAGNVVAIGPDLELVSIWDIKVEAPFQPVVDALSAFVKQHAIHNQFLSKEPCAGVDVSRALTMDQPHDVPVVAWEHFHVVFPPAYVHKSKTESVDAVLGKRASDYQVFSRSMRELTVEAGMTTLELIDAGSIYRGEEHKAAVAEFIKEKLDYRKIAADRQGTWCWMRLGKTHVTRVRNTALGTLLIDLSEGMDVDVAVTKFEKVMAPTNYKRPKAIFTKKMVEAAEAKIKELGFEDALYRRHAVIEDITVNNVLFVDRAAKKAMGVFDDLKADVKISPKKFDKVDEISIDDFVANVLPHTTMLELMPEGRHEANLMSLVAPVNKHAPSMFKWDNNFSWSYNGDIADSMKENVKKAGGNVDGVLRFSIQWNEAGDNNNDFDAHCIEPDGNEIFYRAKHNHKTQGTLDVDIMQPGKALAVENITWPVERMMQAGTYRFFVHCFSHRGGTSGFRAEIECNGEVYQFSCDRDIKVHDKVEVATVVWGPKNGLKFITAMDSTMSSKEMWGIRCGNFGKVTSLMMSPNHWDGQEGRGNRHFFFIMDGCVAGVAPRPYFNEFLKDELMAHKHVFEALGSKLRVEAAENGLSGLGFSSCMRNSILAKVTGKVSRVLKINF